MMDIGSLWTKIQDFFESIRFHDDHYECVLRRQDTLWGIANEFTGDGDAHLQELVDANPQISDPDVVQAGQVVHLPKSWFKI